MYVLPAVYNWGRVRISVPATSANLGPGFDTLGLAINLRNEITIKPSRFLSISTRGEGAENPHIRKNILFMTIFNHIWIYQAKR